MDNKVEWEEKDPTRTYHRPGVHVYVGKSGRTDRWKVEISRFDLISREAAQAWAEKVLEVVP